jgi:hypothetical protein
MVLSLRHLFAVFVATIIGCFSLTARAVTVDLAASAGFTDFAIVGQPFVIELNLANGGPDPLANATLTDVLPAQWSIVSCNPLPYLRGFTIGTPYDPNYVFPSWTNYGNTFVGNGGTIYYGYYRTFYLKVVANSPGSFNHQISAAASGVYDPWPFNNYITQTITVHTNGLFVFGGQAALESSGSNVVFNVVLQPANSVPVTVAFSTGGGTATAGQDYQFTSGTLTFAPGVTNLTVSVPVLNDDLAEVDNQSFTLLLTNAVNAELSGQAQFNYLVDDEPDVFIAISNAPPIVEGFAETHLEFPVLVSRACDVPLTLQYAATGGLSNSGTATIPAGVTSHFLAVPVVGDLAIQSNRTVTVTIADPSPFGGITNATATGVIIEDDGLPGNFDRLILSAVPSPQIVGRPFNVTLTALDVFNQPATNYVSDYVGVSAYRQVGYSSVFEQTIWVTNFVNGSATVTFTYGNVSSNSSIVAWKPVGTGYAPSPILSFKVIASPQLSVTLPAGAIEGAGVLTNAGRVLLSGADGQDLTVQLDTTDVLEIQVPASVFIPAGQTSAVFDVTIVDDTRLDGTHSTAVIAGAPYYLTGSQQMSVQDNETATLSVTLPTGLSEAKGFNSGTGTVAASAPVGFAIPVRLTSGDTTELTLPSTIYIQSGQTSATFLVTAPDDTIIDGPQLVTVTAQVTNWTSGTALTTVLDDDTNITLTVIFGNFPGIEGAGNVSSGLQVRLGGFTSNDVVVQLTSSLTNKISVPAAVLIRAGQQSVTTNLFLPDDNLMDGTQTVLLTGTAPGFLPGTRSLTIPDNDAHHFVIGAIPTNQTNGVPFRVSIQVRDVNNVLMTTFREHLSLDALCDGRVLPVTPATVYYFSRDSWSGNLTINQWGTNVQLRVTSTNNSVFNLSNPFTLPPPAWAENLRIARVQFDGPDVLLFFPSSTGRVYQVESTTNTSFPVWTAVGSTQAGTGAELSVCDSAVAPLPLRFYRLAVPLP